MKKIAIILFALIAALITLFLGSDKKDRQPKIAPPPENNIDDEMSGPRGEQIFIGSGGGRYYIKDGRKIYVGYKNKKQPVS
jgi:hypothetical protein